MKLERMSEHQIRVTLTKDDLAAHRIELSELAYGTNKARMLFQDMMMQAANELDFEADDTPLMIEATPLSADTLVLTITKVDDPEELDTRFAQFAPDLMTDEDYDASEYEPTPTITSQSSEQVAASIQLVRLFSFGSLGDLITVSKILLPDFTSDSAIYKDPQSGRYLLLLSKEDMDIPSFNRACNIVSEYGESEKNLVATAAYLAEHCECIIEHSALKKLAEI